MRDSFRLEGRVALVTGASRGIGRAIALELGRAGARVGVHYLTGAAEAAAVVREIETGNVISETGSVTRPAPGGPGAVALRADLADAAAAVGLVEACRAALGPVDILVNNAGIWNDMPIDAFDGERLEQMLNLNLKAVFRVTAAAAAGMKVRGAGRIVSISSTAGLLGEPLHAHYAASKGGLEMFTRSLAVELGPAGITVNTVAPGWTLTEMTQGELQTARVRAIAAEIPTRRLATPEDVAFAVRFLVSDEARHVNGICLPVEGGYRWRR